MTLDPKLRPTDILTLIINLTIAFVIQHYLAKKSVALKSEKDYLVSQIDDSLSCLKELHSVFRGAIGALLRSDTSQEILGKTEDLSDVLGTLEMSLEFSHCKPLKAACQTTMKDFLDYKALLTGGSFPNTVYSAAQLADAMDVKRRFLVDLQKLRSAVIQR